MKKFVLIWIVGLFTFVPVATYHLLFKAETYQLPLFLLVATWTFGFWPCFVPMYKTYRVKKLYDDVTSQDDLTAFIKNSETKELAIDAIAKHTDLPTMAAEKLYNASSHTMAIKDNPADVKDAFVHSVKETLDTDTVVSAISNTTRLPGGMAEKLHKVAANKVASNDQNGDKAA